MTKPEKWVFRLSDLQTVVQQKLVSTIWSLFIEMYTYTVHTITITMTTLTLFYPKMNNRLWSSFQLPQTIQQLTIHQRLGVVHGENNIILFAQSNDGRRSLWRGASLSATRTKIGQATWCIKWCKVFMCSLTTTANAPLPIRKLRWLYTFCMRQATVRIVP